MPTRISNKRKTGKAAKMPPPRASSRKMASPGKKTPAPIRDTFSQKSGGVTRPASPPEYWAVNAKGAVRFESGWRSSTNGELVAGGKLTLDYDPARSTLRHTHNGFPAWGVTAYVRFEPGGKLTEGPVVQFESPGGRPIGNPKSQPLTVEIPKGTTAVEVWFRNWTGADSPSEAWDSNFGRNYRFDVRCPGVS